MDLDFSFTLRTSIRPTVEKKPKSKPLSGQNKRVLSTTRRKHWQGLFVNNEIDLQQSEKKSEKYIDARKSSAKQVIPAIFSEEVKENLDPSCFVMNTDEKRSNFRKCKKNNSEQLTASSATNSEQLNASSVTNHNSSGEKDFIELGKVSLRKHQRTLYKRNIKDGKLFYKRNVIANFTEFIEKSFASNNSSESRKLSDKVIENGLRISERCQVDRSALNVDENGDEDENDLFSGSLSSSSSRLEKPAKKNKEKSVLDLENDLFSGSISSSSSRLAKKNKDKSVLDGSISSNSSRLAQENKDESVLEGNPGNFLDQSLIVSSPSLLSSSLLGCRPLSNGKKRPGDFVDDCRPRKRSFNTTESVSFENLKTKVKSIMSSDDFSSPSPKPLKTSTDSFIDCISASDSDEHDCSHHLVSKISSTRKSSRKHLANGNINEHGCSHHVDSTGKSKISISSTRKSSRKHETGINGNGIDCTNTATRRKSLRNKCVESNENESCVEHEQVGSNNKSRFDTKSLRSRCVESNSNESANGVEHKQVDSNNRNKFETKNNSGCNRLKRNDFHDKDVNNTSGTKQNFDNNINEVKSTRSSRRKSSKHVLDPTEVSNNSKHVLDPTEIVNNVEVDESYTSVDMFDDSRLSEVCNPVHDNNGDKLTSRRSRRSKEIRINGDRGSVGIALDSSVSNRGKKFSGVGITSEGPVCGETKFADCINSRGDLLGFCSMTSETSERLPSHKVLEKSCDSISRKHVKKESKTSERLTSHKVLEKSCDSISQKDVKKESKTSERLPSHETPEKSCDNISKKEIETVNHPFTRPKTPRRRSCRISGVSNLRKDDSWVSRDMFESDIEDERPKSRLNSSREVDNDDGEIVVRNPDQVHFSISESVKIRKDRTSLSPGKSYADTPPRRSKGLKTKDGELSITKDRVLTNPKDRESLSPVKNCSMVTDQVFYNISESVKRRRDRKSLTPVNSTKPARKSREKIECDPGYVTPSLPRTKLLEITKWLTDSEKSIRQLPPSAKGIPPPLIEEPIEEIVISDSCSEGGDKVKTPPKAKTDKHHATDKQKTRNRTKTDKRSKKVKEESQDKDGASSRVETISGPESKVTDNTDKYRPATANIGMYTEPKKPKKKKVDLIQPSFTEKKPTKTSMFSSSSSSEDLFEKFLEDEKKKRLNKLKRLERFEKLSTERFIYDGSSEEDENDLAFYNDFIGSEVKKDVDCLSEGKWSSHSAESSRSRHGHPRRLSFESQESGGSDRAAIDKALKTKKPRVKPKKRTPDKISKKHLPFRISPKHFLGSNKKTKSKKTATNSSKKTHEDKVIEQIKRINDNRKLEPTTPSTEKSSTKKVPKTPLTAQKPATGVVATPSSAKLRKELFSKTPAKTLSFLGSLSVLDDSDRCHPDAVQYKNNFKKLKEELAKKLFALYNREVFKNRLPEDFPIEWNSRMRSTSGYCFNKRTIRGGEVTRSARIQLSSKILDSPDRLRDTLIHEMCHAATWLLDGVKDAHGPTWKNWTLEAMRRFPELPRIKVCHDYKIKTKYSYKCLGCGYSVGRHSKSLDIEHKRCGYCYGKFELLVNVKETADKKGNNKKRSDKESDTATSTSTQRALRAPTGFALFVKENYARTKQENGNLVHKDVMKLLSEKFAQVKLTKAIKEDDEVIFVES